MAAYCGVLKEVSGTKGGGWVVTGTPNADGSISVPVGAAVRIATEFRHILVGDTALNKIRVCMNEVAQYIRQGDQVCLFAFGHLLRKKIIIGVKSATGPSWTMSFGRFAVTLLCYLLLWPLFVGVPAALAGWIVGMPFGQTGVATGILLGIAYGVGISWLSGYRLVKTYRAMQSTPAPVS
jgi:hypothetical protein